MMLLAQNDTNKHLLGPYYLLTSAVHIWKGVIQRVVF